MKPQPGTIQYTVEKYHKIDKFKLRSLSGKIEMCPDCGIEALMGDVIAVVCPNPNCKFILLGG